MSESMKHLPSASQLQSNTLSSVSPQYTQTQYRNALLKLLPIGMLWTLEKENITGDVYLLLDAWAEEYTRLDQRLRVLIEEAFPNTTTEMIGEWEFNVGLPVPSAETLEERRRNVLFVTLGTRVGTEWALKLLAQQFGYEISFAPAKGYKTWKFEDGVLGQRLWNINYRHYIKATLTGTNGDPFFESVIRFVTLAHLSIEFEYLLNAQ